MIVSGSAFEKPAIASDWGFRCRLVSGIEEREAAAEVGGDVDANVDADDVGEAEEGGEMEVGDEDGLFA